MAAAAILKMEKLPYLSNGLTDHQKIWHVDAYWHVDIYFPYRQWPGVSKPPNMQRKHVISFACPVMVA